MIGESFQVTLCASMVPISTNSPRSESFAAYYRTAFLGVDATIQVRELPRCDSMDASSLWESSRVTPYCSKSKARERSTSGA